MSTLDPLINFIPTKYYFDTFVVGPHHSLPHLIYDLQNRKELLNEALKTVTLKYKVAELKKLSNMIDNILATVDIKEVDNLEDADNIYWINQLGRQSALEISTYGRIRPETMNLLMSLEEDDFIHAMSIAGKLSKKIQQIGDYAMSSIETPIPNTVPIVS